MSPRLSSLSIFFPCYNDGGTIASMVVLAIRTAQRLSDDYEVIVVDDASRDASPEILRTLQSIYPSLRVIYHPRNQGYGGALRAGFRAAGKEFIFYTDGDAQYDPRELARLAAEMQEGVDIVNGYKIERHDPRYRILFGTVYYWAVRTLFRIPMRDIDCDFRLLRRRVIRSVELKSVDGAICVEMMKKILSAGFVLRQVPVHHYFRVYGRSENFIATRLARGARSLLRLWFEFRREPPPRNIRALLPTEETKTAGEATKETREIHPVNA